MSKIKVDGPTGQLRPIARLEVRHEREDVDRDPELVVLVHR